MYQGKHIRTLAPKTRRRLRWRQDFALICAIAVLLVGMIGGTVAYLIATTEPVQNTFTPAGSGIEINETFDQVTKTNVTVTNQSDYPVYIRATYVAYWVSDTDGSILGEAPTLTGSGVNTDNWTFRSEDGYWYYNQIVAASATTSNFINEFSASAKEGYHLVIDVIAESVQAEPQDAVRDVWGFVPTISGN